jgi:S-formylglutathione hydrolase FrmB
MATRIGTAWLACLTLVALPAAGQAPPPTANATVPPGANTSDRSRPFHIDLTGLDLGTRPPTRDPSNPAYPRATELADGKLPPAAAAGNFIIGPTHAPAPETVERPGVAKGRVETFTLSSAESRVYRPGLVREESSHNAAIYTAATAPGDPSHLIVNASRQGSWQRPVSVYIPAGRGKGELPFIVVGDGESRTAHLLLTVLDNLIAAHRLPAMAAILIGSGGQDAQGSERGREYDAVSGTYAFWVESEVLAEVERRFGLHLTRDPSRRATMGGSSSGVAAFSMAWFRPDLYRRVLAYSPTFVNQQWPHDPALPGGAWEYHSPWAGPTRPGLSTRGFASPVPSNEPSGSPLLASSARKPIRFWFAVGDRDLFYPIPAMADGMHDWVLADERMAKALADKGYSYQFLFARNSGHVDQAVVAQTLPAALEWLWADYPRPVR